MSLQGFRNKWVFWSYKCHLMSNGPIWKIFFRLKILSVKTEYDNECFVIPSKTVDVLMIHKTDIRCMPCISNPTKWAPPSEFVSSSIPSWQTLTAHAQPFRGARDLAFCLKVPLDSLLLWASSEGSGETARMRRLAWTFAARIGDKYQIRLARPKCFLWSLH